MDDGALLAPAWNSCHDICVLVKLVYVPMFVDVSTDVPWFSTVRNLILSYFFNDESCVFSNSA